MWTMFVLFFCPMPKNFFLVSIGMLHQMQGTIRKIFKLYIFQLEIGVPVQPERRRNNYDASLESEISGLFDMIFIDAIFYNLVVQCIVRSVSVERVLFEALTKRKHKQKNVCKYPLVTISTEVRFTFIVQQSIKIIIKQVRYNKFFLAPENKIDFSSIK